MKGMQKLVFKTAKKTKRGRDVIMKFSYKNFSCDTEIYYKDKDIIVRFFDSSKEQEEDDIINLVIVDPGYGYLCLKYKGDAALLSGFLDEDIFSSDDHIDAAISFIEILSPNSKYIYTPYHITLFKQTSFIEYNGEY
ncbi:hypothetical protein [Paenibacillus polymyxa]|uniref:hypothetical protein n=3 Tax=Paenibacillus TaxID=44249 RepID=UPI000C806B9F|nr:hypothetical protein [Paenibacillus polymyxa]AUO07881.1 hypothetical protein C0638_15760 [Paenibacillus sp. lzh-N1]MDU8672260.1 hypothetical protein [Paenibacillus polymyxa]MDU8697169.1 hypothetical protein [Paenibacillus polymyxa]MEE4576714.1 hypothetical protein [Paenibacillus polymyxa]URJ56348.1 hypothetical protein MF623_000997 [Paenibacillus polymyxa]